MGQVGCATLYGTCASNMGIVNRDGAMRAVNYISGGSAARLDKLMLIGLMLK